MKKEIKNATAIYTGGNIYIYYGQLLDGNWFRVTDGEEFIEICDSDTSVEEADYYEFYEEHSIETLTDEEYKKFWNEMLLWIIHNAPEGNYQTDELERRMIKMKYEVKGTVTLVWKVEVEASCEEEAQEIVEDMCLSVSYYDGNLVGIDDAEITGDDENFEIYEVEEMEEN